MSIDNNKEASNMADRFMKEVENRIRSAYNYGFKDGTEQGRAEPIEFICEHIAECFGAPCIYLPMDEIRCIKDCENVPESECWRRYFEVMQRRAEQ